MDSTRPDDGLHHHVLKYFWTRVLDDRETCETQFDLDTGEERGWNPPPPRPLSQVAWVPFSPDLAAKVTDRGQPAVSLPIPPIVMDLDPTEDDGRPILNMSAAVHLSDYYLCSRCGTAFTWDGSGTLECPECKTRNQWFCSRCKSLKLSPKFYPRGEVRCADCEEEGIPHGLLKINNLVLMSFSWLETIYNIGIEGKFKLSFGEQEIRIER